MKILLSTNNHLGDAVVLTAVLRNAKQAMPEAEFDYEGNYPEVFLNNPDITPFDHSKADYRFCATYYPFSQKSGNGGNLCQGYSQCLAQAVEREIGTHIEVFQTSPCIYLSKDELSLYGDLGRFCVINANCQKCSEVKGYPHWQRIIDSCPDMKFVQVGGCEKRDITTELNNVIDLRGKTSIRQLLALVSKAEYVLSPASAVIHIAAAFPLVKAYALTGAREPIILTKYKNVKHFATKCCYKFHSKNGCMKFSTKGMFKRCYNVSDEIDGRVYAKCMCYIRPEEVSKCLQ